MSMLKKSLAGQRRQRPAPRGHVSRWSALWGRSPTCRCKAFGYFFSKLLLLFAATQFGMAHSVTGSDADFLKAVSGAHIGPFLYLGAEHMVTGYDYLLCLFGVVFFA